MKFEYVCALSGVTQEGGVEDESDGMGDTPVGWTRVHFMRRQINPEWAAIQRIIEATVDATLKQLPPQHREPQRASITLQVKAPFASLLQMTPMYITDVDEVVFLSDGDEVVESINEVRASLGLDEMPEPFLVDLLPAMEEDEEDDSAPEPEPEPEPEGENKIEEAPGKKPRGRRKAQT